MELVTQYSRAYRRAYERSISEQKIESYPQFSQDFFKGHSFNFNLRNCYQQENNNLRYEDCDLNGAKDLRIDKSSGRSSIAVEQDMLEGGRVNGSCCIKQEHSPTPSLIRRYFCIFCKLDFKSADDFLDHLERHPNGSFVLVKREPRTIIPASLSPPPPPSSLPHRPPPTPPPKIILNHSTHHRKLHINDDNQEEDVTQTTILNSNNNNHMRVRSTIGINGKCEQPIEEEEDDNLTIIPEMLKNQIKIEPISEDEDEEDEEEESHINNNKNNNNNSYNQDAPQYNNSNNNTTINNQNHSSTDKVSSDGGDPNQQLLVLSNPRIGDGPGEYLCNVCQAKFVYKNNLKSHLKRHLGIYPYVCFCGKRYQFKCKLNKHIEQAHAKIKNFKCPVPTCPKKYFTRNDLAFHISVTHQERQEIPCNICQKVFNSQKSLQIHCRKYHRIKES